MRTNYRVVLLTALAISAFGLSACSSGFDPDKLDIFGLSEKKKLPGERKDSPDASHLNSVLLALSSLEKNRARATRSTS